MNASTDTIAHHGPEQARGFLAAAPRGLLIDGRWQPARSGRTFDVVDPSSEQTIAQVALAEAFDVDAAVRAAQSAFEAPSWSDISAHKRARYLLDIATLVEENADELGMLQSLEMGAVYPLARSMAQSIADVFRYYAGWTTKLGGRTNPSDSSVFNYTLREPLGVVGAIVAWNGPLLAASWKLAPALACGNTVVMKPADVAPLAVLRLAQLMQQAGLPDGVINMVPGLGSGAGEALIHHRLVAKLAFTGSTAVGKHLFEVAAGSMKKISLELGGKSANVVFADADLDKAAAMSAFGFAGNTGQMCVAGSRIFVHDEVYDAFTEKLALAVRAMKTGSPFDVQAALGPLSSKAQYDRVSGFLQSARDEGARMLVGGASPHASGYFVEPTIFVDVRPEMRIVREEIFGPVAVVVRFTDEADAIARANDTEYGLSATVWTRDAARALRMGKAMKAGTVWVNTMFNLDPVSPFGGYKASGVGRELGPESIDNYTQIKSVYVGMA